MAEFIRTEEKVFNVGEPVIFENNTDSDFSVSAAIVFRKSGLYDVSIVGRRTIISKVAERKKGRWLDGHRAGYCESLYWYIYCSECLWERDDDDRDKDTPYCPNCGADMRGESD